MHGLESAHCLAQRSKRPSRFVPAARGRARAVQSPRTVHARHRCGRQRLRWEGATAAAAQVPVGDGECTGHGGGGSGSSKHCADGEVMEDGGTTLFNGDGTGVRWSALPRNAPAARGRSMEGVASLDSKQQCAMTALTVGGKWRRRLIEIRQVSDLRSDKRPRGRLSRAWAFGSGEEQAHHTIRRNF
jgi:hypothetical protein